MRESIGKRVKLSLTAALVGTMGIVAAAPAQATELDFAPDVFDSYSLDSSDWGDFDADLGGFDEYSLGNFGDTWDVSDSAYDFGLDASLFADDAYDLGMDDLNLGDDAYDFGLGLGNDALTDIGEDDLTFDLVGEGVTDLSAYDIDPDAMADLGLDPGEFDVYDIGVDLSGDQDLGNSDASIRTPPPSSGPPVPSVALPSMRLVRTYDCKSYVSMAGPALAARVAAFAYARNIPEITLFRHTDIIDLNTSCAYGRNESTDAATTDRTDPAPSPSSQPSTKAEIFKNFRLAGAGLLGAVVTAAATIAFMAAVAGSGVELSASNLALLSGCVAGGVGNAVYVGVTEGKFNAWSPLHASVGCIGAAIGFFGFQQGIRLMNWIRNYRTGGQVAIAEAIRVTSTALRRAANGQRLEHVIDEGLPSQYESARESFSSAEDQWFDTVEEIVAHP